MSQPQTACAGDDRARTHIKALATEAKTLTEGTTGTTAMAFGSGMLTGLAASVQILDGDSAEAAMETIVQRLETAIGKAHVDGSLPLTPPPARDQIATAIRSFPFDDYGMDDVSYALEDTPETQEWVPALADAVLTSVPTDAELRDQLTAAIAALGKSETELAQLRRRNHLAHKGRRAAEHKLDGIRRALCDIGAMQDDDPYSHADLEDVIRQAGRLDELAAAVAADLDDVAEDAYDGPLVPAVLMDAVRQGEAGVYQPDPPIGCLTPQSDPSTEAGQVTEAVHAWQTTANRVREAADTGARPPRILIEQIADTIEHALMPVVSVREVRQETARRAANDVLAVILPASPSAGLREQLAAPIDRILGDWPEHNRTDEHEAVRNEITEAVLAVIPPATRIAADRARNAEATVQRVVDLYERWVKAGPPPLGAPLARWWDKRLVELREAVLGTKEH